MADVSATRLRAALRGRESVARYWLQTGSWGARVYAALLAVPALAAVLWPSPARGFVIAWSLGVAALVLWLSFRVAQGGRAAAVVVLGLFVLDRALVIWQNGLGGIFMGLILNGILAYCLIHGVRGAYALAAVERERPSVPPRVAEPAV
jgi:hypothetical protein